MRPSNIYKKIEVALNEGILSNIPNIANTYQEKLIDSEAAQHLRECGVVICYYFLRLEGVNDQRTNSLQAPALFTLAVIENPTQHKKWIEENPLDNTFKSKSALEIAEEVISIMVHRCNLNPCGFKEVEFPKPPLERVQAEKGIVQIDVNVMAPSLIKS